MHSVATRATHRADVSMEALVPLLLCAFVCASSEPLGEALKKRRDVLGVYAGGYDGYQPTRYAAIPLNEPIPVLHVLSPAPLLPQRSKPNDHMYAASMSYEMYARPYDAQTLASRHIAARLPHTSHYYGSRPYSTQSFGASQTYSTRHPYSSQSFTQHPYPEPVSSRRPWTQGYRDSELRDSEIRGTRQPYPAEVYAPEPVALRRPYAPEPVALRRPHAPDSYEVPEVYHPREAYAEDTAPTVLYARPNKNGGYSYKRKPVKKRTVPKKLTKEDPVLIRIHKYRIIDD